MCVEAGVDGAQRQRGANQQRRPDNEHDRQRDLGDDERPTCPRASTRKAAGAFHRANQVNARCIKSRQHAKDDAGHGGNSKSEREDSPVDLHCGVRSNPWNGGAHVAESERIVAWIDRQEDSHTNGAGE